MTEKLKYDAKFEPVSIDEGNEYMVNGIFIFNITKMIDHINKNKKEYIRHKINVKTYKDDFCTINEEHLPKVDLSVPVIVAEIRPGSYRCIDGRHRLERACREGMEELYAYFLSPQQHMKFLTTKEGYGAYIEYYNSKIENDARDSKRIK